MATRGKWVFGPTPRRWLSPKSWKSEKNCMINSTNLTGSPWYLLSSLSFVVFYFCVLIFFIKVLWHEFPLRK